MRALVTGGSGFVGTHLSRLLRERGDEVVVAGRAHEREPVDVVLELDDAASVRRAVDAAAPEVVFHLAAQAFVPESIADPLRTYDVNALGTARLFEALRDRPAPPRVVLASSAEVYGSRERADYPLHETLAPRPATPYAASKVAAEAVALAAWRTYGVPVVLARAFNHIGPGQDKRFAIPAFALQLARVAAGGPPLVKVGNLDALRDFLDVRDVVAAYAVLAERGRAGEIYNVCSGTPVSLKEMLRRLIMIAGVAVEVRDDPERMRKSDVPTSYGDPGKLRADTGWEPQISLDAALRDVYEDAHLRVRSNEG
jgi:GDP-4-dehydro-6-deoxy-D-mannose reductase